MCKKNYATKLCAAMTAMSIVLSGCAQSTGKEVNDNSSSTSENQITEEANDKIAEDIEEESDDIIDSEDIEEYSLTPTQRNSVNMLNYMSALTQEINASSGNQMVLEEAYSSLVNDIYPNAVDTETQAEITSLMDTIENYRMITVKRKRLEYIYEQNRAQALHQAIPNPVGVLSAVQSGNILKSAVSVLYMAVDSVSSYKAATSQADFQYIQDGWELEDQELTELHNSTKNALSYMFDMVRDYDFDGDYALSEEAIKDFVKWKSKPDSQLISKIEWFQSHKDTYQDFGPYWLELVKDYYNSEDYENCIESIRQYESVSTRIFRKDTDKANVLPMVIVAAKETLSESEYIELANSYCSEIYDNTKDDDWSLRYFVAQIYMDLNALTKDELYLKEAYEIALGNVNVLVDEQRTLNKTYMEEIQKVEADKDSTKREKEEIKKYNKLLKEQRKVELPPVSEALYLNTELLFALANEMQVSDEEQERINAILHENGNEIFLTKALDNRFWLSKKIEDINSNKIEISFDGENLSIPAAYIAEGYAIQMTISSGKKEAQIDDWSVKKVKRPKKAKECSEFIVSFESKKAKDYKYHVGDKITIKVDSVEDTPDGNITLNYKGKSSKKFGIFDGIKFERQK